MHRHISNELGHLQLKKNLFLGQIDTSCKKNTCSSMERYHFCVINFLNLKPISLKLSKEIT